MLYEHLLTVEDEIDLIWRHNITLSSWVFLVNRAVLAIGVIDLALTFSDKVVSANIFKLALLTKHRSIAVRLYAAPSPLHWQSPTPLICSRGRTGR